jgi:hypothetical protein
MWMRLIMSGPGGARSPEKSQGLGSSIRRVIAAREIRRSREL